MKQKAKKIILIIAIFLIIFNVILPTSSYANVSIEGIIFDPISFFIRGLGDAVMNVSQKLMLPGSPKAIMIRSADRIEQLTGKNAQEIVSQNGTNTPTVPIIYYSPAAIFANKVPSLDVNFISPSVKNDFLTDEYTAEDTLTSEGYTKKEAEAIKNQQNQQNSGNLKESGNSAAILTSTISKWYIALRNISLLGLLIVLVYLGIRIMISATADEQAKYKEMLKNWVMAIILVAVIHYIMMFLLFIVETISNILTTSTIYQVGSGGDELFNQIRTLSDKYAQEPTSRMGYTLMYAVLVMYTLMFTIRYIKRVIYMAFLTVIAPMVALTYPIDKANDGQAQAFNMWFKEYLFNLLIQPVHLILYIILVSSAIELAKVNMIYALVAIGFLLQAEKFIKDMFGIQGEGGAMDSNFVTGAAFGGIITKLSSGASKISGATKSIAGSRDKIRMHHSERGKDGGAKQLSGFGDNNKNNAKKQQQKGKNKQKTKNQPKNIRLQNQPTQKGATANANILTKAKKKKIRNRPANANRPASNRSLMRGVGNLRRRYLNTNTLKKVGKLAMMGYGAGIGGALGVAAGLASDDYKNVLTQGATGASAGALTGKAAAETAGNVKNAGLNAKDTFQKGWYGDEYADKKLNPYLDKKWRNDPKVIEHYQTKYGNDWKNKMEESMEFRRQGVVDQKEIDQGLKLKDDWNKSHGPNEQINTEQAANIMSLADVSRDEMMNNRDQIRNSQVSSLIDDSDPNKDQKVDQIMELLDQRFGTTGSQTQTPPPGNP